MIAIETGDDFARHLCAATNDDRLRVVNGSASDVLKILSDQGIEQADCILSGLPFSTLSPSEAAHIVRASGAALGARGIFAAYQMRTAVEPALRKTFASVRKGYEWWNIPPCHLYWASGVR